MSNTYRFILVAAAFALATATFTGCGAKKPEGSMTVPRGSTITVRTAEALTTQAHPVGSEFQTQLETALATGNKTFVPAGTLVDGTVEEIETSPDGRRSVTVRLVRMHLPDGSSLRLETNSITRTSALSTAVTQEIDARTGIAEKIRYLAETADPADGAPAEPETGGFTFLPADSPLVFGLGSELVLLPPK